MSETPPHRVRTSTSHAFTHHFVLISFCVALGALLGWSYLASTPTTYTSTARVLVNPSVGNPYAPTPASVRQDEATSLETEAQVARSEEVLGPVVEAGLAPTAADLGLGLQVTVPPNTQILEISYTDSNATQVQQVADAVADSYLANRARRFEEVNSQRIARVEERTNAVVEALRDATAAAQQGSEAQQSFQAELAEALRNELVSLRAQLTALENSEAPAGEVISPASTPENERDITTFLFPIGGAAAGLALGFLLALLLERFAGVIRSTAEVERLGLPVLAAMPRVAWSERKRREARATAFETTIRRVRAKIFELEPRPDVIAVAPADRLGSGAGVAEALAESLAKAGHRVVLVQTHGDAKVKGVGVEEQGLAQALVFERLDVMDLLQPSVEPLLSLLPHGGFTAESRELLVTDRLRAVLTPLIDAGHFVVVQAPGVDSVEGEACLGAADLGLVVVTLDRTHLRELEQATWDLPSTETVVAALVVGARGSDRDRAGRSIGDFEADSEQEEAATEALTRAPQ